MLPENFTEYFKSLDDRERQAVMDELLILLSPSVSSSASLLEESKQRQQSCCPYCMDQGLFSEINLNSEKLGKTPTERNKRLCTIIQKIAEGIADFSTDSDTLGDAYEYLIGQFAAGSGKKAGEFYTPQQISTNLSSMKIAELS